VKIAIVGTGVSGLVCAHLLHPGHDVTVFESAARPGGHTNTVRVDLPDGAQQVDTGFIVFNDRNYPSFTKLLQRLGVAGQDSEMSFSVADERTGMEWRGTSLNTVFAQRGNVLRPGFLRMLADVARFNRAAKRLLLDPPDDDYTLEDLLREGRWSPGFVRWYLVPLGSAIWSADPRTFNRYPAATFARFFDNHGLLSIGDQPQWRTVTGGAARYVDAILRPLGRRLRLGSPVEKVVRRGGHVEVRTPTEPPQDFDHVILATHADQALGMLSDPTRAEREVLGAMRSQPNVAVLHTDERLLPRQHRARASWNYHVPSAPSALPTVTYDLSRLQSLESSTRVLLTLNRPDAVDPTLVLETFNYDHPVFDSAAIKAQRRHGEISGVERTSFCGAYWGHGFHEDGVRQALEVCRRFGVTL
jgi:predicted NAD/FAD-binding protein